MKDYQKLFAVRENNLTAEEIAGAETCGNLSAVFVQGLYSGFAENERA